MLTLRAVLPSSVTVSMPSKDSSCVSPLTAVSADRSVSTEPVPLAARVMVSAPPERDSDSRAAPAFV